MSTDLTESARCCVEWGGVGVTWGAEAGDTLFGLIDRLRQHVFQPLRGTVKPELQTLGAEMGLVLS